MRSLVAWLGARSARERVCLAGAATIAAGVAFEHVALAVRGDLALLTVRVQAHERELATVRRAAATLARSTPHDGAGGASLARLEAAAVAIVGRERIAAMTPGTAPAEGGVAEERVALKIGGATLAETIALLHGLEAATPPLHVARLEMRKHPDDGTRFDVTLEVVTPRSGP